MSVEDVLGDEPDRTVFARIHEVTHSEEADGQLSLVLPVYHLLVSLQSIFGVAFGVSKFTLQ